MKWLNEPDKWNAESEAIRVTSDRRTDFWRITHDGGIRDNGHFWFESASGDFDARVRVHGKYRDQYDQAGLMVRVDESNWLKCGIELKDGVQYASAVVTRQWSDWSVIRLDQPESIWMEIQRRGQTFEVLYSLDGKDFQLMRQTFLEVSESVDVGLMVASPIGGGFEVEFQGYRVELDDAVSDT